MSSPQSGTVAMNNNPNPSSNSDSNPSEVASAEDDECIAPVAIFDAKMRGYIIFTSLFTCLAFVTLLLYRPMDPRELITQAALQRSVEGEELFSPYRTIQYKLTHNNKREENATNKHYLITTSSLPQSSSSSSSAHRCPTYPPEASATFAPTCSILPPLPKLSLPNIPFRWERNEFVAPLPKDPLKLRDGSVRPLAKSPIEMADQFKKWEGEFAQLLGKQNGQLNENVMKTFYEYLHSAVDPLEVRAEPIHTVDQAVTILDGRKDPMVIFGLKHTFNLLGPGWGLVFFHTSDNEEWIIDQLKIRPGEAGEHIELRRVQPVTYQQANSLPMSSMFHEKIPVETILLIQPDAFMLRSPWLGTKDDRDTWNDLLAKNAYLGAPWGWCSEDWCRLAGNGGVSMRKRSVLTDLISEIRCDEWSCAKFDIFREATTKGQWWDVEDTAVGKYFLTHHQKYRDRISSQTRMGEFSLEHMEVPSANPFFVHKVWNYQSQQRWLPLLAHVKQYYPELW